jgi:HK97 family phage major capsid protein
MDALELAAVDRARAALALLSSDSKPVPFSAGHIGLSRKDTERYSIFRAIRALRHGPAMASERAPFEMECSAQVAKQLGREQGSSILVPSEVLARPLDEGAVARAMSTGPGSKGGYLVGVQQLGFVDILRARSVAARMGCTFISGLVGNVSIPRQVGKSTVTWQTGDGASVNASDQTIGQLSMTPRSAIAITEISEQLLRQTSLSAESFVMADLAKTVAIEGLEYCVVNGAGGAQPLGIKNTSGVTTGQDSASATYAKIMAFITAAGSVNAINENPGWVTNTAGAAALMQRQRFTSTDTPLWEGNVLDGTLAGFRSMSSEQLASGNLIFGSWGDVIIGEWGVLELDTDRGGTRFNQAQVGVRAMWMVDVLVRYPQSFIVSTNLS